MAAGAALAEAIARELPASSDALADISQVRQPVAMESARHAASMVRDLARPSRRTSRCRSSSTVLSKRFVVHVLVPEVEYDREGSECQLVVTQRPA